MRPRPRLLLPVIALIAAACNGGSPQQPGPGAGPTAEESPSPAAPGEVVYQTDFSTPEGGLLGGDRVSEHEGPKGGSIRTEYTAEGTLRFRAELKKGEGFALPLGADTGGVFVDDRELVDLGDVSVEADATLLDWQTGATYGVQCRGQGIDSFQSYEGALRITEQATGARIYRSDSLEQVARIAETDELPPKIEVEEGVTHRLRLDCIGDTITFFVDGRQVLEATDDTYDEGAVALSVVALVPQEIPEQTDATAEAEFDNLVIREVTG